MNMRLNAIGCILLLFVFSAAALPRAVAAEQRVWPLPALDDAAAWTVAQQGEKPFIFEHHADNGALFVRFDCAKDNIADLRLKEPVPMPDGVTGFTFLGGNNGTCASLWIRVLARDSKGKEIAFYTTSRGAGDKGWFSPEATGRRGCEERFTTPGFGRPKPAPNAGATLEGGSPTPPYTLLGLRFIGGHQLKRWAHTLDGQAFTEFFFRGFAMTKLDSRTSPLYYQFRSVEGFGELDPLPCLTPGHMGKWRGKRFDMSWELRDRYDGTPFLVDGKTFEFTQTDWQEKSDGIPYPLQIAQRIEFPVKEKGTYWARVRLRWSYEGKSPLPQEISEREFRLDVVNGAESIERAPVPADAMAPNCFIRVAPDRMSLIFEDKEKFVVKVAFRNPGESVKDASYRAVVRLASDDVEVKALDIVPIWNGDKPFVAELDLSDLKPGVYKVLAEIRAGKQMFDQVERMIARKEPVTAAAVEAPIPASVPSWREMLASPKPMFHLSPILPDNLPQSGAKAWDEYYRPFLDKAGELSTQIELSFNWKTVAPLPGVYDWGFVDRFVDYAQSKGLTVQLQPSFRDLPEWMPARYEMGVDGTVFGVKHSYLFHGGRPNFINDPAIRNGAVAFIRNVAQRYRAHPAVQSYFFLFEHPGDAPYNGWYEGYAPESVAAFRREAQTTLKTIAVANQRWGTAFASWDEVVPPPKEATSAYWLDWLRFKTDGIEGMLRDCVTSIRSADPKRLIMMYADGLRDNRWFHEQGCMSANGGSHDTLAMPDYAAFPLVGLPQRTEDHSPGNWTAYSPTQLDASLFAMMAGGGANAHCKAFVLTKNRFSDMADPNVSLGRYKRFMPIWSELRQTELVQPVEAFLLKDLSSYLLGAKTTYTGWWSDPWMLINLSQAQVPCAAGVDGLWEKGKLLLATGGLGSMEKSLLDRVVRYVEAGGTLLMYPDSGRKCLEDPDADWVLLRRFGIEPPPGEVDRDRKAAAVPVAGAIFTTEAKPFTLRDAWKVPPPEGMESAACFDGDKNSAALSWKPFGKGKVAVVWARTIVIPDGGPPEAGYPFLRDVARWAGIQPMAEATDSHVWTNLLKTKDGSSYYGLTKGPGKGVDTTVRWLLLPDGDYRVTELISGNELGEFTAARLKMEGLPVKLEPRETVAIFRMVRKETKP
jgi:hypothetical protein